MRQIKPYDIYDWLRFSNDHKDVNNRRFLLTGVADYFQQYDKPERWLWSGIEMPTFRSGGHNVVELYGREFEEKKMIYIGNLFDLLGSKYVSEIPL